MEKAKGTFRPTLYIDMNEMSYIENIFLKFPKCNSKENNPIKLGKTFE